MTNIFGDERDTLVSKWNQIQAFFGSGKGYFNQQGDGVDFDPSNPFCRFKVRISVYDNTLVMLSCIYCGHSLVLCVVLGGRVQLHADDA